MGFLPAAENLFQGWDAGCVDVRQHGDQSRKCDRYHLDTVIQFALGDNPLLALHVSEFVNVGGTRDLQLLSQGRPDLLGVEVARTFTADDQVEVTLAL